MAAGSSTAMSRHTETPSPSGSRTSRIATSGRSAGMRASASRRPGLADDLDVALALEQLARRPAGRSRGRRAGTRRWSRGGPPRSATRRYCRPRGPYRRRTRTRGPRCRQPAGRWSRMRRTPRPWEAPGGPGTLEAGLLRAPTKGTDMDASQGSSNQDGPVVVGVDPSPCARDAAGWAAELAAASGAPLLLLHVVPPRPAVSEAPPWLGELLDAARRTGAASPSAAFSGASPPSSSPSLPRTPECSCSGATGRGRLGDAGRHPRPHSPQPRDLPGRRRPGQPPRYRRLVTARWSSEWTAHQPDAPRSRSRPASPGPSARRSWPCTPGPTSSSGSTAPLSARMPR